MVIKHSLVVNCVAKSLNLVRDITLTIVELLESLRYAIVSKISVLNWSWVAIEVIKLPASLVSLEDLIWQVTQLHLLGWNDQLLSSVSGLWL